MESRVETSMVQNPKISVSFGDTGDLEHQLTFKCVLKPGDTDRLIHMFKERVQYGTPIILSVSSPQARFDLKVTPIEDNKITKKVQKVTEDIQEEFHKTTPIVFNKVDFSIQEGLEHPYRVKVDDIFEGEGDCPRDAVLLALVGSANLDLKINAKDGKIVDQLSNWLYENYPVTDELEKLVYALKNNNFEVPVKAK